MERSRNGCQFSYFSDDDVLNLRKTPKRQLKTWPQAQQNVHPTHQVSSARPREVSPKTYTVWYQLTSLLDWHTIPSMGKLRKWSLKSCLGFCVLDEELHLIKENRRQGRKPALREKTALGCTQINHVVVLRRMHNSYSMAWGATKRSWVRREDTHCGQKERNKQSPEACEFGEQQMTGYR